VPPGRELVTGARVGSVDGLADSQGVLRLAAAKDVVRCRIITALEVSGQRGVPGGVLRL
jgi:hypothetical protein